MGTNFYYIPLTPDRCEHCGRGDTVERIHIGKKSYGWQFHFHGTETLHSRKHWDAFLAAAPGRIEDEHGKTLTLDELRQWWDVAHWGGNKKKPNRNAYDESIKKGRIRYGVDWQDPEGFAFGGGEFS